MGSGGCDVECASLLRALTRRVLEARDPSVSGIGNQRGRILTEHLIFIVVGVASAVIMRTCDILVPF